MISIDNLLQSAIQHQINGRLQEAESTYRQILLKHPNHADALNLLGGLALQVGNYVMSEVLIKKAIDINPENPLYHSNLGIVFVNINKFEDAVGSYKRAISLKPDYSEAHNNLGVVLKKWKSLNLQSFVLEKRLIIIKTILRHGLTWAIFWLKWGSLIMQLKDIRMRY